jgi:hypothetical protein
MSLLDKFRNVSPQEKEDSQVIEETNRTWKYLYESRRRREFEWFVNDQFYNNNQYLRYNVGARRVETDSLDKYRDKVTVNICYQQVRGVTNFLNAEHPTVGIRPGDQADDAYLRARKEQHLADYWYDHLQMNEEAKLISTDGGKYGVGWAKILWDNDAQYPTKPFTLHDGSERDYMYGEVTFERTDPFEVYPDPLARNKQKMRYICHAVVRTVGEIQNNQLYRNTDKVTSDQRLAASYLKQFQIRQNLAGAQFFGTGQKNGMDTVLTLELYRKIFNKETNRWEIWVTTRTESGVVLRHELWPLDEFPFEYFQTDVAPFVMDSKGTIHNIREVNRALNQIVSQMQESARIMGKLNWSVPRGSNLNVIDDSTGQLLEYDVTPGGRPEPVSPGNLPGYLMQLPNMYMGFMQDIGGMHNAFNGKAPFAQASGDLVDKLSTGDQNNLTLMRDNYDDFFRRSFKLMLKTAKKNYKDKRDVPSVKADEFGEYRWIEIKPSDISISDDVKVSTGTSMPYSIPEKQQMFMNLWKEKVIQDPNVILKLIGMPDIDNMLSDDEQDIDRQLNEIRAMMKGKDPKDPANKLQPLISEDHQAHIKTLDKFVRGDKFKTLSPQIQQWIMDHRSQHIDLSIQLTKISQAMQVEPIKRSVTLMERMNKMSDTTPIERTQLMNLFGLQSDAAQVQLRGGLYIQDPAQAEMQAQNEDIEMMDMRPVQVSFGDNHQVHIETHAQVVADKGFKTLPQVVQKMFMDHIKEHVDAMTAIQASPGLVPDEQVNSPPHPHLNAAPTGQMPEGARESMRPQNPTPDQVPKSLPPKMQEKPASAAKPIPGPNEVPILPKKEGNKLTSQPRMPQYKKNSKRRNLNG